MDRVDAATINTTQREAIAENRSDRKRSLDALHDVEAFARARLPRRRPRRRAAHRENASGRCGSRRSLRVESC